MRRWLRVAFLLLGTSTVTGALPVAGAGTSGVIVFDSNRDGDSDLYAVNPDGSALTQLTHNDVEDSSPLPSPNGRLIAFHNDSVGLAVVNADGSDRRALRGCTRVRVAHSVGQPCSSRSTRSAGHLHDRSRRH